MFLEAEQRRVKRWLLDVWGEGVLTWKRERALRFLEESLELVQACGLTKEDALKQLEWTYNRPAGNMFEELGQVQFVLFGIAATVDIPIDESYEECIRIAETPERKELVFRKNLIKREKGL